MASVGVRVMGIGHMGMRVPQRLVVMAVTVFADRHRVVNMVVMGVVLPMCVLMLQGFVRVLMAMGLGQVQHHAGQHQRTAHCPLPSSRWRTGHRAQQRRERQ